MATETRTLAAEPGDDVTVVTRFEACATFEPADGGSLCTCGWLDSDHPRSADVTALPTARRRARGLAS
jgi:hypothetical protein